MILIRVPAADISIVEWTNDIVAIRPRVRIDGDGALNPNIIRSEKFPQEIRSRLATYSQEEMIASDFPPPEEEL
jgi:autonomous glycyl radical cofactor GrcA